MPQTLISVDFVAVPLTLKRVTVASLISMSLNRIS